MPTLLPLPNEALSDIVLTQVPYSIWWTWKDVLFKSEGYLLSVCIIIFSYIPITYIPKHCSFRNEISSCETKCLILPTRWTHKACYFEGTRWTCKACYFKGCQLLCTYFNLLINYIPSLHQDLANSSRKINCLVDLQSMPFSSIDSYGICIVIFSYFLIIYIPSVHQELTNSSCKISFLILSGELAKHANFECCSWCICIVIFSYHLYPSCSLGIDKLIL